MPKTKTKTISISRLLSLFETAKKILLTTHENPDGDGIGSLLALYEALRQKKKNVTMYMKDPVPGIYSFLPGQNKIKNTLSAKEKYDLTVMVDLGEQERVSAVFHAFTNKGCLVSIDHHYHSTPNTDYSYCLPQKAASGEIIYALAKRLKTKITKSMATNLYTAIATDTGSFRYSNTTAETFGIASALVSFGVDVNLVAQNCFETYSLARMALLKRCMATLQIHSSKKIAWAVLKTADFKKTQAAPEDTEGFINYPRSIDGVEVALFFKQTGNKKYKVGLRSKKYVDVSLLANKFGGGGHKRASGCTVYGTYEQVKKQVVSVVEQHIR